MEKRVVKVEKVANATPSKSDSSNIRLTICTQIYAYLGDMSSVFYIDILKKGGEYRS